MKKSKLSSSLPRLNHFLHKSRRSSIKNAKGIAQEIQKQAERPYVKTKGFFNQSIPNAQYAKYFGNGISQVLQLPLGHLSIGYIYFVYKDKTLVCCNMLMALCRFLINIYLQTVSNFVNCNNRIFGCVHHMLGTMNNDDCSIIKAVVVQLIELLQFIETAKDLKAQVISQILARKLKTDD